MLLRIFFDNEIPQEEKYIFVRRYLIVRVYRSLILGESLRIYPPTLVALEALYTNVVKTHLK